MKEHPSYEPNRTYLSPELGERACALMWTRTGEPLNPHRLLARQEEGEVAVLAREENFLDGG